MSPLQHQRLYAILPRHLLQHYRLAMLPSMRSHNWMHESGMSFGHYKRWLYEFPKCSAIALTAPSRRPRRGPGLCMRHASTVTHKETFMKQLLLASTATLALAALAIQTTANASTFCLVASGCPPTWHCTGSAGPPDLGGDVDCTLTCKCSSGSNQPKSILEEGVLANTCNTYVAGTEETILNSTEPCN
jgi:hypothetical protein